jgi:hypothetical protein
VSRFQLLVLIIAVANAAVAVGFTVRAVIAGRREAGQPPPEPDET